MKELAEKEAGSVTTHVQGAGTGQLSVVLAGWLGCMGMLMVPLEALGTRPKLGRGVAHTQQA
jgi:hypothetical protein